LYNPANVRSDVLSDIMSSHYLHIYRILGLNGVHHQLPPSKAGACHGQYTLLDNKNVLHAV
jgi:hypothetical protein